MQEKATGRHVPIVATTAHAMIRDRDRCMQAGMDEYLSKPIQRNELMAVLARQGANRVASPSEPPAVPTKIRATAADQGVRWQP
jgi:two-component system, sensor histidine kinase and response regulator